MKLHYLVLTISCVCIVNVNAAGLKRVGSAPALSKLASKLESPVGLHKKLDVLTGKIVELTALNSASQIQITNLKKSIVDSKPTISNQIFNAALPFIIGPAIGIAQVLVVTVINKVKSQQPQNNNNCPTKQ